VTELLRTLEFNDRPLAELDPAELLVGSLEGIGRRVIARVRRVDPAALRLAQALAVLGMAASCATQRQRPAWK
jgi:hypothetical protein